MNIVSNSSSFARKLFTLVLGLSLTLTWAPLTFAISVYSVGYNPVAVGTATVLELEYTVDVTDQTWADNDTLTIALPANLEADWSDLTFAVEFDEDSDNDGIGEVIVGAGGGPGQYSLSGSTLTVKWNQGAWAADNGDSIRVVVDDAVFQYADATTSFTFGGATVAGGDTNPGWVLDIDIDAADAAASVVLGGNSVVGAAGDTTVTLTLPTNLAATATVDITFPAHLDVSAVAFGSETFGGAGTFSGCADAGQVVTCTAGGAITAGTGNIVMTGIVSKYVATTEITSLEVEFGGVAANDIATDGAVTLTDSTAADAAASVVLGTNSVVGRAGSTTVSFTYPSYVYEGDTVDIAFPSHMDVSGVSLVSHTFAGGESYTCSATGQVVTCETTGGFGVVGAGSIVLSGILATSASTTDITSFELEFNGGADDNIATDSTVSLTDTTLPSSGSVPLPPSSGGSSSSSSSEDEEVFNDLDSSSEYYDAIMDLYERDIIGGYEDGSIQAEENINRAELMKIIVLAVVDAPDADEYKDCFTDVSEEWFAPTICYAKDQGWVIGYPDESFGVAATANNVEVLKMILSVNGVEVADPAEGEEWYTPYVTAADEMGLIDENNFEFGAESSRGFAFQLLSDLLGML